ncbi:leucine-rich repeat domain-containing protein [Roseivirga sp.]|uniref:leucine-rich repeat domain-containing protein n=1 Tax=Roseivirga sp. TaxID=1964215 RepID=UPI003B8E51BA
MTGQKLGSRALLAVLCTFLFACGSEHDDQPSPSPTPNPDPFEKTPVNIPDENFEARLGHWGIDTDGEINGQIFLEDALKVTSLDLFTSNAEDKIADLTGIEVFINLKQLIASYNALSTVDLSQNTALEKLDLSVNKLKQIDLSANTELTILTIGRNDLESIDLSHLTKLETLFVEGNQLESLDVSNNTALTKLNALANLIEEIKGLNATKMKELWLGFNYLKSLSISLPSLEGINVENNDITQLDLENCINLKYILATSNQIAEFNTSNHTLLKHLKLSNNDIKTLDLTNNKNLEILWASSNELSQLDISSLSLLYDLRITRNTGLSCIKIDPTQQIPTIQLSDYQNLSTAGCN